MFLRLFDLDGSVSRQKKLLRCHRPVRHDLQVWGPRLRLACGWAAFGCFEQAVADCCQGEEEAGPMVTLLGSGDFHHLSLALLRRLRQPFNLLVLDKHPDWMRGLPFLHCGTWLYHAARWPLVQQVFHVGGETDFDNAFGWLAPWPLLRTGKIAVFPAQRCFRRGRWQGVPHQAVRAAGAEAATPRRLWSLLEPFSAQLRRWPLYVSLDKDVLVPRQAAVNWDSGHLTLAEIDMILAMFRELSDDNLIGMDIVGDWSPVQLQGLGRGLLHLLEHPAPAFQGKEATRLNQETNLFLLDRLPLEGAMAPPRRQQPQSRFTLKG